MKISDFSLTRLHNEEHFQFHLSFKNLVVLLSAIALKIEMQFNTFVRQLAREQDALDKIAKSSITDELTDADNDRDEIFRGFCDAVKSALNHYRLEVRQAAGRLQIVVDSYGNLATKPYDAETGGIISFTADLQGTYAADVATVGLTEWVIELNAKNMAFDTLKNNRYTEEASKTQLRMKEERTKTDAAYRAIVERINALMLIEGDENYSTFVNELNKRIESYNNTVSIRRGKAQKPVAVN